MDTPDAHDDAQDRVGAGAPRHGRRPRGPVAPATVDADGREIPFDLAGWIDDHDTPRPDRAAVPADAAATLEEQRMRHEPDDRAANEAVGDLVNNTGDDGGAASG